MKLAGSKTLRCLQASYVYFSWTLMKKVLCLTFALCHVLVTSGCADPVENTWQTIHISECGTLEIPEDWHMFENDDRVYIVDADNHPIMIQTHSYCGIEDGEQGTTESNEYFEDVTNIKYLTSAGLSNSASFGEVLVSYEGVQSPKYFLTVGYERRVMFIVWSQTMDEEMLHKIAETFVIDLNST